MQLEKYKNKHQTTLVDARALKQVNWGWRWVFGNIKQKPQMIYIYIWFTILFAVVHNTKNVVL